MIIFFLLFCISGASYCGGEMNKCGTYVSNGRFDNEESFSRRINKCEDLHTEEDCDLFFDFDCRWDKGVGMAIYTKISLIMLVTVMGYGFILWCKEQEYELKDIPRALVFCDVV